MPNIKSQVKRLRQAEKRRLRNKSASSAVRTKMAGFNQAVEKKDKKDAEARSTDLIRSLDKAAAKGIIHRNQASNKKSKIMRKVNDL
ncbi:MAG: 30S ribosomal protein S20 [Terriglobia bacterium]